MNKARRYHIDEKCDTWLSTTGSARPSAQGQCRCHRVWEVQEVEELVEGTTSITPVELVPNYNVWVGD